MKLGLIAGNRNFPFFFAENARKEKDIYLVGIGFKGITEESFASHVDRMYWIGLGQFGKLLNIFKEENITRAVMAGQIPPVFMLKALKIDLKGLLLMAKIRSRRARDVLGAIADKLSENGIKLISSISYLEDHLAGEGVMGKRSLSAQDKEDITFGLPIVRKIVDLDIGQTVVVKKKAVIAVEAMEGTDRTVERAGAFIQKKGGVVFKLAMTDQDLRFDVPVVGVMTIKKIARAHLSTLAVDSAKTLLLDKPAVLKEADKQKITLVGV